MTDNIATALAPSAGQTANQAEFQQKSTATDSNKRSDLFAKRWRADNWRALFYFNLLRMWLAATFLSIAWLNTFDTTLGKTHPGYFLLAAGCLLLNGILQFLNIALNERIEMAEQATTHFTFDLICLGFLIYSSGGIGSSSSLLLILVVAASGVLLPRGQTLFIAALGTIVLIVDFYIGNLTGFPRPIEAIWGVGITLFCTAFIVTFIAERARRVEKVSALQQDDIQALVNINASVIRGMENGIIICEPEGTIRSINRSARRLLGYTSNKRPLSLRKLHPTLNKAYSDWHIGNAGAKVSVEPLDGSKETEVSFKSFGKNHQLMAIYINNQVMVDKRAHELKLASLGKMAAAVAHEIRNPLTVIQSAAELMALSIKEEKPLKNINTITRNCDRINAIINDILSSSRPDQSQTVNFAVRDKLAEIATEFCMARKVPKERVTLDVDANKTIEFSATHFQQIISNLCENSLIHNDDPEALWIKFELRSNPFREWLDIISNSNTIDKNLARNIFEPFFTTRKADGGTGLGLYVCQQLAELNDSELSCVTTHPDGTCFRLYLPKSEKRHD